MLAGLAFAKGDGMPVEVIRLAAQAFQLADQPAVASHEVDIVLAEARTYVRRGTTAEGRVVFQFRSDAFASYLRSQPYGQDSLGSVRVHAGDVLDALLSVLPTRAGRRRWHCAHPTVLPYLLRHAIEHTSEAGRTAELFADPEFLVYANPDTLREHADEARSGDGATGAELYRAMWDEFRAAGPEDRRQILAIAAARLASARQRSCEFLDRLAKGPEVGWPIRWVRGSFSTQMFTNTPVPVLARCVTLTQLHGRPVAVFGCSDGRIRRWDLATDRVSESQPIQRLAHPGGFPATPKPELDHVAAGIVGNRPIVVTGGQDGAVRFWDLDTLEEIRPPQETHIENPHDQPPVSDLTVVSLDGRAVAVTAAHRSLEVWDLATGARVGAPMCPPRGQSRLIQGIAVTWLDGRPTAVTLCPMGIWAWDLTTHEEKLLTETDLVAAFFGVTAVELEGRPALAYCSGERVVLRDAVNGRQLKAFVPALGSLLTSLSAIMVEGRSRLAVGYFDGTLVFDPESGEILASAELKESGASNTALGLLGDGALACVASGRFGRIWRLGQTTAAYHAELAPAVDKVLIRGESGGFPVLLAFDQRGSVHTLDG